MVITRVAWALAALLAAAPLVSLYTLPVGPAPMIGIAALAVVASVRPFDALLVYAALSPLATILYLLARGQVPGLHFVEAMTLALLAGWALHRAIRPRALAVPSPLRWIVFILLAATFASAILGGAMMLAEEPGAAAVPFFRAILFRDFLLTATPVNFAFQFAEGLGLVLLAADMTTGESLWRDRILRMMVLGASGAAAFNVLRIVLVALAREDAWTTFWTLFATLRVNVHFADLNAAGSYFALMLPIAAGFAARPALAIPCTLLTAAALWLSGSRTAIGAVLITGAAAVFLALRPRTRVRAIPILGVLAVVLAITFALWKWYPQGRNEIGSAALAYRVLTVKTGLQLTAAHPVFGVGLGRFAPLAEPYVGMPQNAHNNFVQVMAELGIPGLILFVTVILLALRAAWIRAEPPGPAWGLLAGLIAFLITCLAGHPLLITAVAYPFWTALGLAGSTVPSSHVPSATARRFVAVLVLVFAATLPFRVAEALRQTNLEHASVGFSVWQREPDGSRYRWAGGRSTFFVDSSARAVRIPLRRGAEGPPTLEVRIFLNGREANRVVLEAGGDWRIVRLILAGDRSAAYSRVDLEATAPGSPVPLDVQATYTGGALMVGRPVVEK